MDKRNLMTEKSPINWIPICIGLGIAVAAVAIIAVFMLRARGVIGPDTKSTSAEYESGATQSATTDYGKAVEAMMKEYMEENGYTIADESYEALQNEISNDVISKLSTLDLSSLSEVEKTQLMKELRKEILTKLTDDSSFSAYLTGDDYKKIEERLEKLDESSDADVASLKKTIEELTNKMNTSTSSSAEEYERVKQLVEANKNLSNNQREELLSLISSSQTDLTDVISKLESQTGSDYDTLVASIEEMNNETKSKIHQLDLSQSASLKEVNDNLTNIINANKDLSDETKEQLLTLISQNQETSTEALSELYTELSSVIANDSKASKEARDAIISDLSSLSTTTASTISALDKKYAVYYEESFSVPVSFGASGEATTAITSENIKSYSSINIVYDNDCTSGYTVSYKQENGKLTLTLKKNAEGAAPSALNGTIYIDNSMDNAQ